MTLNARQVETAKPRDKAYKLADGGGLYLMVNTNGSKYWRMKYRFAGKEKKLSFGTYLSSHLLWREIFHALKSQLNRVLTTILGQRIFNG